MGLELLVEDLVEVAPLHLHHPPNGLASTVDLPSYAYNPKSLNSNCEPAEVYVNPKRKTSKWELDCNLR